MSGSLQITDGGNLTRMSRVPSNRGILPVLASGASAAQQAQAIVRQFYNYINQRDYPAAYSLWGQGYHSQTRYCDFVGDYAHTLHDDVQVTALTPLGDGMVQVGITITAQEDTPATHTYKASYIVGQENSVLKMLSGTQNLVQ